MKYFFRISVLAIAILTVVASCGYRNPYVYSGPERSIYVTNWNNRTSELQLDARIYQSLLKWFQKSGSLTITKDKEGADFILAGEIVSISLPTLTYNSSNSASNVNIRLTVRYVLKDLNTEAILIEQPKETWTEEYQVTSSFSATKDNENDALEVIIDELSQKIYQRSLLEFAKM